MSIHDQFILITTFVVREIQHVHYASHSNKVNLTLSISLGAVLVVLSLIILYKHALDKICGAIDRS